MVNFQTVEDGKKINFLRVVMPLTNCFLSFLGNFQQTRCLLLDNKIQWNRYDMTEFPVSRLKFPLVKHFAQINKSTINITVCFVHWWTVRENLCYPIKSVILNSLIFPPFSVDSTESIGVCNSKQARCWKCQRQWSFITSQQILASLKSLFSWFFVTRLILLQSIEAQQKSEPCQKVKELPCIPWPITARAWNSFPEWSICYKTVGWHIMTKQFPILTYDKTAVWPMKKQFSNFTYDKTAVWPMTKQFSNWTCIMTKMQFDLW